MRTLIVFLFILFISSASLYSQAISGTVCEKRTNRSVPGVNVYLDGTSIHTTTDADGKFELRVKRFINTRLIISHVIYETVSIDEPFKNSSYTIFLKEKNLELNEIVIKGKMLFPRKQMLEVFKANFLGDTKEGRSCIISNEDDINLRYDATTFTLLASSENPLIIKNQYLGYEIRFQLLHFDAEYKAKTLDNNALISTVFYGTSSFVDLKPDNAAINKRRQDTYKRSTPYFMKNLADGTCDKSGHKIYKKGFAANPDDVFSIQDTLSGKMIRLAEDLEKSVYDNKPVYGKIAFLYNKNQSGITFLTDSFFVDQYGNTSDVDKIMYSGYVSEQRLGNMLPLNYELPGSSSH
ncbi:MAG: carboxypeptidase-like regulatory domain-containing protein [Dysgonamonadaceae bacterium]|jgi:hypothetical protein|nr:carboxypeptidase-like regulatory domain-containing protein [Dysgonamonadaceae bacterium]